MPRSEHKKIFLSGVSIEFRKHRNLLANDLKRPTLDTANQHDFGVNADSTLGKLDTYIQNCQAVIHIVGLKSGEFPPEIAVKELLQTYLDFAQRVPAIADRLEQTDPKISYTRGRHG